MGSETMRSYDRKSARRASKGFTLIASLLLLVLLSGMSIGLLMMVNTEQKVGGTDLQNNVAFHTAEGGIEVMQSNLVAVFQSAQSPTAAEICAVSNTPPTIAGVTWKAYNVVPGPTGTTTCPSSLTGLAKWGVITGSGQNAGLQAQIIPVNMLATAALLGGQEVTMVRGAEVALIPVFQFGVFCEGDCAFFSSPNLDFVGRIHTNADLYIGVADSSTLTFHSKLDAYGNIVTKVLPNGLTASSNNDSGTVYIPKGTAGCDGTKPNCGTFPAADGSVVGAGGNPAQSAQNTNWSAISTGTFHSQIIDGDNGNTQYGTGARKLAMPFVDGTHFPFEIIRRPKSTDSTALTQSREYNLAQIRVLLSDNPAELPGGATDVNNVRLANITTAEATATSGTVSNPYGIPTSYPTAGTWKVNAPTGGNTYNTYFATGLNSYIPDTTNCNSTNCPTTTCSGNPCTYQYLAPDWPFAPNTLPATVQTLVPIGPPAAPVLSTAAGAPTVALCPPTDAGATTIPAANIPPGCQPDGTPVKLPYFATSGAPTQTWNLIDGYLRVEYVDAGGTWHPVTNEWLQLGFARDLTSPTMNSAGTPAGGVANDVNPQAILLFQEPADRAGDGGFSITGKAPSCTTWNTGHTICTKWSNGLPPDGLLDAATNNPFLGENTSAGIPLGTTTQTYAATGQSITMNNWYPINFYDAREGEPRDVTYNGGNADSCTSSGMMNAVEIDVGNLQLWLKGTIGTSGANVDYVAQNGYVLYFSDRRGMLSSANPPNTLNAQTGDSGLEDVVNSSSAAGTPDNVLEPIPAGHSLSPEDVNQNGVLDEWGTANLGQGQWNGIGLNLTTGVVTGTNQNIQIVNATPDNPYSPRITSCVTTGRKNWVSGARHVLKLVDGALGNLPVSPTGGGFTVASENPVYIQGDYNSNSVDTFFTTGADMTGHVASSVIADAVTILSDAWLDLNSTQGVPTQAAGNRTAVTTSYRTAIAAGKNMAFPFPSWETNVDYGFGTDGGVHNFLRFLEDWQSPNATLHYGGSLVSLYYSTYNTGLFKCCNYAVYQPPTRDYNFDTDFTLAGGAGLPPGTPMFRDIDSLSYRQMFTARTD